MAPIDDRWFWYTGCTTPLRSSRKDHKDIDQLLTQISRLNASDKNLDDKVGALIENVDHHIEEEEREIFQFAEENCSEQQLDELARQIEAQKRVFDQGLAA